MLIVSVGFGIDINCVYIDGFVVGNSCNMLKLYFGVLFVDYVLVMWQFVEDFVKYKWFEGVQVVFEKIVDVVFDGVVQWCVFCDWFVMFVLCMLVIWGECDEVIFVQYVQGLLDGVCVEVIVGSGYMVQMEVVVDVNCLIVVFFGD